MEDEQDVIEVVVPVDNEPELDTFAVSKTIFSEITAGIGIWGAFRPIIAIALSLVPFLFLGQHFNRNHQKGKDWFLLQIPLAFTLILWILLYLWSIFDAWKESSTIVSENASGPNLVRAFD